MSRRGTIPPRHRVFCGCEGESERGYVAWLQRTLDVDAPRWHLDAVLLKPGAGDPWELIKLAGKKAQENEQRRGAYKSRWLFLDADRRDEAADRRTAVERHAYGAGLRLVWQEPNHEGLLLRHLPGCETLRPPAATAASVLRRHWPDYAKPMSANDLAARLDANSLRRAIRVEADLAVFLRDLGFT